MTAAKRREHQPDPWLRTISRYAGRKWGLPYDCPCHGWPGIREAVRCCGSAGMRYIASEGAYVPWEQDQP